MNLIHILLCKIYDINFVSYTNSNIIIFRQWDGLVTKVENNCSIYIMAYVVIYK